MEHILKLVNGNINAEMGINMFIHCLILLSFLSIFFYIYITKITYEHINAEFNNMIKDILKNSITNTDKLRLTSLTSSEFYNKLIASHSKVSDYTTALNNVTFYSVITVNLLLWLFLVVVIYLLKSYTNIQFNLTHIIIENIATFTMVGIVEYLFFVNIASKFIPVTPSFISNEVLTLLKKKFI